MNGFLRGPLKSAFRNQKHIQAFGRRSTSTTTTTTMTERSTAGSIKDVPGLSKKTVDVPNSEVGPGASKKAVYKNPEYFCYHNTSYFEAEVEMSKYRCPQPSNK